MGTTSNTLALVKASLELIEYIFKTPSINIIKGNSIKKLLIPNLNEVGKISQEKSY